ncbi:MAG: hypothetical protein AB1757_06180 [Acidobacteriota bacterium]
MQPKEYARLEEKLFPNQDGYFSRRKGFWARQFQNNPTRPQIIFDALFGILAPVLCFYFDPIVFRSFYSVNFFGFMPRFKFLVYAISVIAIITLLFWLAGMLKKYSAIVAGIFLAGFLCSFSIGVAILPLSFIGLLFGIGVLGFVPFVTATVYWRNLKKALEHSKHITFKESQELPVFLGFLLAACLPLAADFSLSRIASSALQVAISKDANNEARAVALTRLNRFYWYVDSGNLIDEYQKERDEVRKTAIAETFKAVTNRSIENADD